MKSYTILFRGFPESGPLVEPVTTCVTASTLGCALNRAVKRADEKIRARHTEREADLPEKDRTKRRIPRTIPPQEQHHHKGGKMKSPRPTNGTGPVGGDRLPVPGRGIVYSGSITFMRKFILDAEGGKI